MTGTGPRLGSPSPQSAFTREEWAIVRHHKTPRAVQQWLHRLPYNHEKDGGTLRSFRGVVEHGVAHCLEAALSPRPPFSSSTATRRAS